MSSWSRYHLGMVVHCIFISFVIGSSLCYWKYVRKLWRNKCLTFLILHISLIINHHLVSIFQKYNGNRNVKRYCFYIRLIAFGCLINNRNDLVCIRRFRQGICFMDMRVNQNFTISHIAFLIQRQIIKIKSKPVYWIFILILKLQNLQLGVFVINTT